MINRKKEDLTEVEIFLSGGVLGSLSNKKDGNMCLEIYGIL